MPEWNRLHIKTCLFSEAHTTIQQIRESVFQQEQGIDASLEWDGLDNACIHLVAQLGSDPAGVARLREVEPSTLKLERLAVLPQYRKHGIGSEMVHTAIAYGHDQGYRQMVIHSQARLESFYQHLGFQSIGKPFEEAGIVHLKMQRSLEA
ncbi:MAG TPA: GNAT family N-acetyltransferase [Stenomitos sp.]